MFRLSFLLALGLAMNDVMAQTSTATFENLIPTMPYSNSSGPAGFYNNGGPVTGTSTFSSGGATFNNTYNSAFGGFWSGWSYSTVTDTTTPGFLNQYAAYAPAIPGAGASGSATYAVAYSNTATITMPEDYRPFSIQITNTTYAALSMLNGDAFAKKFGGPTGNDPDFFKLIIKGFESDGITSTGSTEFYLADYRFSDNSQDYIVSNWTTVDLSMLGGATRKLAFEFVSSDVGPFGINTPVYFAADDLVMVFSPIPEPITTGLIATASLVMLYRRRC